MKWSPALTITKNFPVKLWALVRKVSSHDHALVTPGSVHTILKLVGRASYHWAWVPSPGLTPESHGALGKSKAINEMTGQTLEWRELICSLEFTYEIYLIKNETFQSSSKQVRGSEIPMLENFWIVIISYLWSQVWCHNHNILKLQISLSPVKNTKPKVGLELAPSAWESRTNSSV